MCLAATEGPESQYSICSHYRQRIQAASTLHKGPLLVPFFLQGFVLLVRVKGMRWHWELHAECSGDYWGLG